MGPILENNTLPIRRIYICDGWCGCQGDCGKWCPNEDHYSSFTVINTPNTHIASAYALLRKIQERIFKYSELDFPELSSLYEKAKIIRKIISDFESY